MFLFLKAKCEIGNFGDAILNFLFKEERRQN
jgi:hypothetical protein